MITIYTQPSCPQCRAVHMLLEKNKILFNEIQEISIMEEKGIDHTPALETEDGRILQGKEMMNYINTLRN